MKRAGLAFNEPGAALAAKRETHVRYLIVAMLFIASCFSYGDRTALSVGGVAMQKALGIGARKFGLLLSAAGWSYVCGQLPSGALLDRFGSRLVYGISIVAWSISALLVALAGYAPAAWAFTIIFALRLLTGAVTSPVFPGNARIVAAWFPTAERGGASAIFNSSQYFALAIFAPFFGWLTERYGWQSCFWTMGAAGLLLAFVWTRTVYSVPDHPRISQREIDTIEQGGGLVRMDSARRTPLTWASFRMLLGRRMLVGIYIGQFCINTLTIFFLTWFPSYLVQARHMSILHAGFAAALPALSGFVGGILGGVISDGLLRRGCSLTFARKAPIIAGMLLSVAMIGCNYTGRQSAVMALMSLAFFGKGFGALGWSVIADVSPKEMVGVNGGVFNLFGNLSTVTTPLVIGFLVDKEHSFNGALVFVGASALVAIFSYLFIVGEIKRIELKPLETAA